MNIHETNGRSVTEALPRNREVITALLVKRNQVGRLTREGKLLSNLIRQTLWRDHPESNRSWAKHPTQNLPWMMGVQVEALARGN